MDTNKEAQDCRASSRPYQEIRMAITSRMNRVRTTGTIPIEPFERQSSRLIAGTDNTAKAAVLEQPDFQLSVCFDRLGLGLDLVLVAAVMVQLELISGASVQEAERHGDRARWTVLHPADEPGVTLAPG